MKGGQKSSSHFAGKLLYPRHGVASATWIECGDFAPAGEVLSCRDKKVPKETLPKFPPFGSPALLAPVGLCRQAFPGLTAKWRASCAPPFGLFLLPLRYSAGMDGPKPASFS